METQLFYTKPKQERLLEIHLHKLWDYITDIHFPVFLFSPVLADLYRFYLPEQGKVIGKDLNLKFIQWQDFMQNENNQDPCCI